MQKQLSPRICAECGDSFVPARPQQMFCCGEHQRRFHKVMEARGQRLVPFSLVERKGKSGYGDIHKYALRESNALRDRFNAEDKAAGRNPALIVAAKMKAMWTAADLGK